MGHVGHFELTHMFHPSRGPLLDAYDDSDGIGQERPRKDRPKSSRGMGVLRWEWGREIEL